jgi:pyruvate,water dikinase
VDAATLLARRRTEFEATWVRFQQQYPRKNKAIKPRLEDAAEAVRVREAVRSELVRLIWVARDWALQAGKMTNLGEDIFFLTTDEVVDLLSGEDILVSSVPTRRSTYERYKSLPPYPMAIRGGFDPFQWAEDPHRRTDFYDSDGIIAQIFEEVDRDDLSRKGKILGAPGSAGIVEGLVRRLDIPEEGATLQSGEILVTTQTNIGWSHLFPLAGAVVTDVGAALSHAAIVARELGIPAVVNCGNATMLLKTGDRVRVDGGVGLVEIIEKQGV